MHHLQLLLFDFQFQSLPLESAIPSYCMGPKVNRSNTQPVLLGMQSAAWLLRYVLIPNLAAHGGAKWSHLPQPCSLLGVFDGPLDSMM